MDILKDAYAQLGFLGVLAVCLFFYIKTTRADSKKQIDDFKADIAVLNKRLDDNTERLFTLAERTERTMTLLAHGGKDVQS